MIFMYNVYIKSDIHVKGVKKKKVVKVGRQGVKEGANPEGWVGKIPCETDGDARRLPSVCKFRIFWSCLGC